MSSGVYDSVLNISISVFCEPQFDHVSVEVRVLVRIVAFVESVSYGYERVFGFERFDDLLKKGFCECFLLSDFLRNAVTSNCFLCIVSKGIS